MTLILTTLRPDDITITSDGRSTEKNTKGETTRIVDTLQKVFPVPDHPLAICHHGENILANVPIGKWIKEWAAQLNAGNLSIVEVADQLRIHAHAMVRARLRALAGSPNGFGLIVAGFDPHDRKTLAVEVFWRMSETSLVTEERAFGPLCIICAGNGKEQIPKADNKQVEGKTVDQVRAYHQSLMTAAIKAKETDNSVGGHVHELVITADGCRWTLEPKKEK